MYCDVYFVLYACCFVFFTILTMLFLLCAYCRRITCISYCTNTAFGCKRSKNCYCNNWKSIVKTADKPSSTQTEASTPGKVDGREWHRVGLAVLESRRPLIPHRKRAEERVGEETGDLLPWQRQRSAGISVGSANLPQQRNGLQNIKYRSKLTQYTSDAEIGSLTTLLPG